MTQASLGSTRTCKAVNSQPHPEGCSSLPQALLVHCSWLALAPGHRQGCCTSRAQPLQLLWRGSGAQGGALGCEALQCSSKGVLHCEQG